MFSLLFTPQRTPKPIPDTAFTDSPSNSAGVNYKWLGHILAVMDLLQQEDYWQGTDDEIRDAIEAIEVWLEGFMA